MVSKLLVARRSLRDTEWDGAYLDHFVEVISRLDARRHGFGAGDLGAINAAWAGTDEAAWAGGFVAKLQDGRLGYVDGEAGAADWGEGAHVEAAVIQDSQFRTASERQRGWQDHAWDEDLARRLNEFLRRVANP